MKAHVKDNLKRVGNIFLTYVYYAIAVSVTAALDRDDPWWSTGLRLLAAGATLDHGVRRTIDQRRKERKG